MGLMESPVSQCREIKDFHTLTVKTLNSKYIVMSVLNFVIKSRSFSDEELSIGFRTTQAIIGSCYRMFGLLRMAVLCVQVKNSNWGLENLPKALYTRLANKSHLDGNTM